MTRPLFRKPLSTPHPLAGALVVCVAAAFVGALALLDGDVRERGWPFTAGFLFGVALQRGELSLVRAWRDLVALDDPRQMIGLIVAFALAATLTLGSVALSGASVPPPGSRILPISGALPVAAFLFGYGAVLARGSLMVHLRRIGEGSLIALPALLATFAGFVAGIVVWPFVYPRFIEGRPAVWLPHGLGVGGALAAELAVLAAFAAALIVRPRPHRRPPSSVFERVFVDPWPAWAAGVLVGLVAAAACALGEPLGLTGEGLAVARRLAVWLGWAPTGMTELESGALGLVVRQHWPSFSGHAVIVVGVIAGSFAAAAASGRFSIVWMTPREAAEMAAGGFLIGLGGTVALGTVTGAAISGVAVGALSGWIFLAAASAGIVFGLRFDRRPAITAPGPDPADAAAA